MKVESYDHSKHKYITGKSDIVVRKGASTLLLTEEQAYRLSYRLLNYLSNET